MRNVRDRLFEIECRLNLLEHAARCERGNYIKLRDDYEKTQDCIRS